MIFTSNFRTMVYYINAYEKNKILLCEKTINAMKSDLDEIQNKNIKKSNLNLKITVGEVRNFYNKIKLSLYNEPVLLLFNNKYEFFENYLTNKMLKPWIMTNVDLKIKYKDVKYYYYKKNYQKG